MAYEKGLAHRLEEYFEGRPEVEIKKMFGGLCFMVNCHMCCGIVGDTLMARVGPDQYEEYLSHPHAREMDFTGRAMKDMVYVSTDGIESDANLRYWIQLCEHFVESLPKK
jgi:TfoX/Sxy family transcriptional regulator of competence genes